MSIMTRTAMLPVIGLVAMALPATAMSPVMNGGAGPQAHAPSFGGLVLVQGFPPGGPMKGPPPKGMPPPKGPPPKGWRPPPPPPPSHGRGVRYMWGGLPFFFYDGYYHGDCSWLRRKARETGSSYWWRRYRQCRDN